MPSCKCAHSSPTRWNTFSTFTTAPSGLDGGEKTRTVGLGVTFQKEHTDVPEPASDPSTPQTKQTMTAPCATRKDDNQIAVDDTAV
jgi:hypothetical protein